MAESMKINIKLPSSKQVTLNISPHDSLVEVRTFLNETSELTLHQNYFFTFKGQVLNEYVEFGTLKVEDQLDIKFNQFEERSAKYHLKQVQKMIANPDKITHYLGNYQKPQTQETKKNQDKPQVFSLKTVLQSNLKLYSEFFQKNQNSKLLETLTISQQNPPPSYRRILDDYFYICFKSLEGTEFQITASSQGFFVNNSNKRQFDPTPHQSFQQNNNLLELLRSISPGFKQAYNDLLESEPNELFLQQNYVNQNYGKEWIRQRVEQPTWELGCELNDLYGIDTTLLGDWNEDIQICKSLPQDDFYQRINKDKTLIKIHNDFLNASVEGAKAVIQGNIMSVNPMDKKETQVFIYNHIFFSFALETPLNFKQELGQDTTSSVSAANQDLRNLNLLHKMNIPNLNLLNTALIDYKGYRVIAQSIIPGILNQDQQNCTQYGSIDDGQIITKNEDFHELLKQVCKNFYLEQDVEFKDGNNNIVSLAGALEVKGILGSDKRKYILDLMRLSPRDINYLGDDNLCCVFRLELIENYIMSKYIEQANQKLIEYQKQKLEDQKDQQQDKQQDSQQDKQQQAIQDFLKYQEFILQSQQEEKSKHFFNSNIETSMPLHNLPQQHQINLKKLADYIQEQAIPNMIKELKIDDTGRLGDSKSLSELFHFFGVNNRYLGNVYKRIDEKQHPNLKILIEKVIFVRSLKHVLREQMRDSQKGFLPYTIAHVLNCFFSSEKSQQLLNQQKIVFEMEKNNEQISKKKNKKSKNLQNQNINNQLPQTPQQLMNRLKEIALNRYQFEIKQDILKNLKFNTISALRDLCLNTGIVLQIKDYIFQHKDPKNYQDLPFSHNDIIDIQPIIKNIEVSNEDVKYYMEGAEKLMVEQRLQESLEMFQTCLQVLINLYGPIKKEISVCYSKLAQLYFRLGKIDQSLIYQKLSVQTLQMLYGCDNYLTAHAFLHLGLFYFGAQIYQKAEKYLLKSLYLKLIIGGEAYPDINLILWNLSLVYQQSGQLQIALDCLLESNELITKIYGENNIRSAGIFQAIAMIHFEIEDLKKAVQYQEQSFKIFQENLKQEDPRFIESQLYLKTLKEMMDQKQKTLNSNENLQNKRIFGQNKPKNKVILPKETEEILIQEQQQNEQQIVNDMEREILLQKLKQAKQVQRQMRGTRNFKQFG